MTDERTLPIRNSTKVAIQAIILQAQRNLQDLAQGCITDGEVPAEGWKLNTDRMIWEKVEEHPVS